MEVDTPVEFSPERSEPLDLRTQVRASRAQAYLLRAMFFEARDDATAVLSTDPTHAEALRCLALALDGLGRHEEALALMQVSFLKNICFVFIRKFKNFTIFT